MPSGSWRFLFCQCPFKRLGCEFKRLGTPDQAPKALGEVVHPGQEGWNNSQSGRKALGDLRSPEWLPLTWLCPRKAPVTCSRSPTAFQLCGHFEKLSVTELFPQAGTAPWGTLIQQFTSTQNYHTLLVGVENDIATLEES